MKIILNQYVVNLGEEGDVVVVKDGYAVTICFLRHGCDVQ
jgi:ribosomal protein L9